VAGGAARAGDPIGAGAGSDALDDREHRVLALAAVPVVVALLRARLRRVRLPAECRRLRVRRIIPARLRAVTAEGGHLALTVHREE
jgi:hypothetical protein